jgi:hypothetical protein
VGQAGRWCRSSSEPAGVGVGGVDDLRELVDLVAVQGVERLDGLGVSAQGGGSLIGLAAFGVHLVVMGYLVVQSGEVTKVLGYLLVVAGAAYITDTVANALLSNYDDFEALFLTIVVLPSVIAELALTIWLLTRAGHEPTPQTTA